MKEYDAKDAWLELDGKKAMNLNINDEQFYGLGDDDWHLPKDNSNQNQAMLLQDFKRRLSQPLGPDEVPFFNISYKQIPEKDY